MLKFAVIAVALLPRVASGEMIRFEADSAISVIRGYETSPGYAFFDIVASRDGSVLCLALDGQGKPIATARALTKFGVVSFTNLNLNEISRVACRYID